MSRSVQLELFGPAPVVSRWPGDGPHPSTAWRDDGATTIRRFFDGDRWCQMLCAPCRPCGVWHPLDLAWDGKGGVRAQPWRCQYGEGWERSA
jgi:hypothetical protein